MKIILRYPFLFLCLILFKSAKADNSKVDSLVNVFKGNITDSAKVHVLHQLFTAKDSVVYLNKALALAKKTKYKRGIALSLLHLGRYYYFADEHDLSLSNLSECAIIANQINDKVILKSCYRFIGFIYRPHEPFKAKEFYEKSLEMCIATGDEISASYALSAIGNVHEGVYDPTKVNNKKALDYYLKSLEIRKRLGSDTEIASSLNECSRMYDALGMTEKSFELRLKGLELAEKSGDKNDAVYLHVLIGNDYTTRKKDYKNALKHLQRAFDLAEEMNGSFETKNDIVKYMAVCYNNMGNKDKAIFYFLESLRYGDSIHLKSLKHDYNLSSVKQDLEKELEKQKLLVKDAEILKEKAEREKQASINKAYLIGFILVFILAIIVYSGSLRTKRLNKELDVRNKEIETAYQTLALSEGKFKLITETINDVFYLYNIVEKKFEYISPNINELFGYPAQYFYEGNSMKVAVYKDDLPLVIKANIQVDSGISYNIRYRIVVNNKIKWVAEKSSPILDDSGNLVRNSGIIRDITERTLDEELIKKKNTDITNSIIYASNIQNAVLAPKSEIAKKVKDFFILNKPKEIVSGDFYFYKETTGGIYIAAVDCTGHGVPAGFMSMIGNSFLNEVVKSYLNLSPAEILDQLSVKIIKTLHQDNPNTEMKDGLDIALLFISDDFKTAQFAGAFNSLIHIRNGVLTEIEANSFSVGLKLGKEPGSFTNHKINLQAGDTMYMMSDGYISQFGGEKDKKFTKKKFKETLLPIQNLSMSDQEKALNKTFIDWMGHKPQVDDVCVIGIRV